jgi:anti-anti-sigma regulatory factor
MKFVATVTENGKDRRIRFSGALDERSELPELEGDTQGRLFINLSELSLINSLGCRQWVKWLKSVKAKGGIVLEECSTPVVNQMNILVGFLPPSVQVQSCYVPYFCDSCAKEEQVIVRLDDADPKKSVEALPETRECPHCGSEMELDISKPRYFYFLNDARSASR